MSETGYGIRLPGVFAPGDVRGGSVKRMAAAVGEGSIAVRFASERLGRRTGLVPGPLDSLALRVS